MRKDAARAYRYMEREEARGRAAQWSQREAVFKVMPQAVRHVSGEGRLSFAVRKLYYAVRPRMAEYTDKELSYDYFRDHLVIEYQREHEEITGLYFEPRSVLYEPHTGNMVQLGTREVAAYNFPAYLYDKLMYAEKTGLWPTLQDARLVERYDMAVATGSGYATTAARNLLAKAEKSEDYQIFVLHDADPDGYNIARTVQKETWRMPGHSIQVIDLGLTIAEADEMSLPFEEYTRTKALPAGVEENLTERERECFVGEKINSKSHRCWRVELDAMTAPQTIEYIERKMAEAGARGKVIPPEDELEHRAHQMYRKLHKEWINEFLSSLIPEEEKDEIADDLQSQICLERPQVLIKDGFDRDKSQLWRDVLRAVQNERLEENASETAELVRKRLDENTQQRHQ